MTRREKKAENINDIESAFTPLICKLIKFDRWNFLREFPGICLLKICFLRYHQIKIFGSHRIFF